MPKMKTHSGAAKRFRKTASGKLRHFRAYHSHILTKKSTKRKRGLRTAKTLQPCDAQRVRQLIPYK